MDTSFLDEGLDMIEVLDRPALFSNGRIPRAAVPRVFMRMTSMKAATQETFVISRHGSLSTMAVRCWSKNPLTSAARTESI